MGEIKGMMREAGVSAHDVLGCRAAVVAAEGTLDCREPAMQATTREDNRHACKPTEQHITDGNTMPQSRRVEVVVGRDQLSHASVRSHSLWRAALGDECVDATRVAIVCKSPSLPVDRRRSEGRVERARRGCARPLSRV